ncbi:MAG: ribokinase [Planctomycetes bacterium]|jgi:ribokinase|nr:ribokinase [Planctomycetota bacterium]
MPEVLNIGSLNIDRVLRVPDIARPGQTIAATSGALFPGGKGANQSVALARAGAAVRHVGRVGHDGRWLVERLADAGVQTDGIVIDPRMQTGQAVIQVADSGQNSIVIDAAANGGITDRQIDEAIAAASPGDVLVLQNETSGVAHAIEAAAAAGLIVALNPAPMSEAVHRYPLGKVSWLIVNEDEGAALAGVDDPRQIVDELTLRHGAAVVLTRGGSGVVCRQGEQYFEQPAFAVEAVDTTAAGDTFVGYFVASLVERRPIDQALRRAAKAASLSVTRAGAIDSVPTAAEVDAG